MPYLNKGVFFPLKFLLLCAENETARVIVSKQVTSYFSSYFVIL